MKFASLFFATLFFTTICWLKFINTNRVEKVNKQQIAEYYNTVLNFLQSIERDSIDELDYVTYFDAALAVESNYVLARVRGYANNEMEAAEWERISLQIFRLHVVRTFVKQARDYYDSFVALCGKKDRPRSLLSQCIREVSGYYFKNIDIEFDFPKIEHRILLYELNRFLRMRLLVSSTETAPFLRLYIAENNYKRFVEEPISSNTFLFRNPIPLLPYNNSINDLSLLRNAQVQLSCYYDEALYNCPTPNTSFLTHCVDASPQTLVKELFQNITTGIVNFDALPHANVVQNYVITATFLNKLAGFLADEFYWLACHPINRLYSESNIKTHQLLSQVLTYYERIKELREEFARHVNNMLLSYGLYDTLWIIGTHLGKQKITAGYSLCRISGLAVVNNSPSDQFGAKDDNATAKRKAPPTAQCSSKIFDSDGPSCKRAHVSHI